jgi:TonB family protein
MGTLFWDAAIKGSLILGAGCALTVLLRRCSAATRHLVWTAAFASALVLPVLSAWLPAVPVRMATPLLTPPVVFQATASARRDTTEAGPLTAPIPHDTPSRPADWPRWLRLLWGVGTGVSLAQIFAASLAMARVRRGARPFADVDAEPLCRAMGIGRSVDILETHPGTMPMAFGLFRPAVFLPADAGSWTAERRRVVLLHELAHVQRGDPALHLIARLGLALYWWNPLAWTAWRGFLKERERAADDLVLHAGARASDYAGHLLEIARGMQGPPALASAALAMARRSQLEGRLLAILDSGVNRKPARRISIAAALLLAVLVAMPFSAIRAQDQTAMVPADVDATIRAATAEKNHQMLENAAKAAEVLQQYDLARRLLDSSLDIRAEASGGQSVAYGLGLIKIADLERSRRHFAEAEAFDTKAVSVLGNRPEAARPLIHLGTAAWSAKKPDNAMDYFQRAQLADPTHAGPALMWMALLTEKSKPDEAESWFKQSIGQQEVGSPEMALTMELYAAFLQGQKRGDEAKSLREQAASLRQQLGTRELAVSRGSRVTAYRVGAGVTPPRLVHKVEPVYSEEARLAKYQGTVVLSVVIGTDGIAQNMRVARGLGLGLNEEALKAIAQWKFTPGAKDGEPVAVQATIEVNFRLL